MVIAVVAILWLGTTSIREEKEEGRPSTFGECLALLGKPFILLCFLGIMCHVGIDVGTNTTAPKILMERLGMSLADAGFATSLYFIFRTAGCFLGAFILQKLSARTFFGISVLCMLVAMIGLFVFQEMTMIYVYRSDWFRQLEYFPCYFLASVAGDAAEEERSQRVDDYGVVWRYDIPACHGCGK